MLTFKNTIKGIGIFSLFLFSNCYHYRIAVDEAKATDPQEQTVHKVVWGLREDKIIVDNCNGEYLQEVTFHSNFGQSLLNVLTLGFWKPTKVTWTCGKPKSEGGTIDVISDNAKN